MPPLRDVELRHLAAIVAVADAGSFARAADQLGFTQSGVSQQIAALEKAVGMALFDRPKGPRRAELTPAGDLLVNHARTMLDQIATMAEELDRLRRGVTGRLVIGTFQSVSAEVLPTLIGRMRTACPHVDIRLFETDDQRLLVQRLETDELDLAFTVDCPASDALGVEVLGQDPFVLIARADEVPAGTTSMPVAELDGAPLIGQPIDNVCQALVEARLTGAGVTPDYVFRSMDNQAVQGMVRSGMGRAVMPMLAIDSDDPGIVVLDVDPPIEPRTVQLARRAGRSLPPAADRFTELARAVCAELLSPPVPAS